MASHKLNDVLVMVRNAVAGVFDIVQLQFNVLEVCERVFDTEGCSIFLMDENTRLMRMTASRGYATKSRGRHPLVELPTTVEDLPKSEEQKLGLKGWIAATGQSLQFNTPEQLRAHPHWRAIYDEGYFGRKDSIHNLYGVPLRVSSDEVIGVLAIEGKQAAGRYVPFTDDDADFIAILAAHIAAAIQAIRHVGHIERQQVQLRKITAALHKVIAAISKDRPMQYLLDEIIKTTADVLSAEACVLFLQEEGTQMLVERAGEGYVKQLIGTARYKLVPPNEFRDNPETNSERVGLTAWIAMTGRPFLAKNNEELRAHPHWRGQYDTEHYNKGVGQQCESFLGVPLKVADRIVGVLKVENKRIDGRYEPFNDQDRQVFETLSHSVAITIHNATLQMLSNTRSQAISAAIKDIVAKLGGEINIGPLVQEILGATMRKFNSEVCSVFLRKHDDHNKLECVAGAGYAERIVGVAEYCIGEGFTGHIAKSRRSFNIKNMRDLEGLRERGIWNGKFDETQFAGTGLDHCHNILAVPLCVHDEALGVIKVENKRDGDRYVPFTEQDLQEFETVANVISLAIHNAELHERSKKRLKDLTQMSAHTINNQVTSYVGISRRLRKQGNTDPDILQRLDMTTQNLQGFMDDLRKYGKDVSPKLEKVDINQVLNQIITEYEDVKPPELELQTDMDDTCLPVFVDQRLFQESIRELFRNATNAIKEDWPGFIRVTSRPTMQDGKECVRIAVMDNGGGLPKEGNPFEPYFTTGEKGSGLGLATVKRVVERHNGTVTGKNWESDTGLGAAIEIILPAAQERGSRT